MAENYPRTRRNYDSTMKANTYILGILCVYFACKEAILLLFGVLRIHRKWDCMSSLPSMKRTQQNYTYNNYLMTLYLTKTLMKHYSHSFIDKYYTIFQFFKINWFNGIVVIDCISCLRLSLLSHSYAQFQGNFQPFLKSQK